MTPVLPPMQVVSDVEVLVPVLQSVMLVMTLRPRRPFAHPPFRTTRAEEPTLHLTMELTRRIPQWLRGTLP